MAVTAALLAAESGAALDRATRVLPVAVQMVEDYAPQAPEALQDEAVYRFGGYLLGSGYGEVRTETLGPMSVEHVVNHAAAFRNSGAAMLLTHYKVRRGGVIGGEQPEAAPAPTPPSPAPVPEGSGYRRWGP